jgi:hypothetical protein
VAGEASAAAGSAAVVVALVEAWDAAPAVFPGALPAVRAASVADSPAGPVQWDAVRVARVARGWLDPAGAAPVRPAGAVNGLAAADSAVPVPAVADLASAGSASSVRAVADLASAGWAGSAALVVRT